MRSGSILSLIGVRTPSSTPPKEDPMKPAPTFWQRLGYAVGLTLALTACFAVISVILWIIAATWRAIIGG